MPYHLNQRVEADTLFGLQYMLFHSVDAGTRFHVGELIDVKSEETPMQILWTARTGNHGLTDKLVIDGEGGLNSD